MSFVFTSNDYLLNLAKVNYTYVLLSKEIEKPKKEAWELEN